jgi:glycerophosphoryl diester phosphodiesterase
MTARSSGLPLVSAHRGGGETHPPATYEAYAAAVVSGAEFAELDIRRLADGTFVVFHDEHVGPGGHALAGLGYRELCTATGYEVPRVVGVLRILADGGLGAHLDLKEVGYEAEVVGLVERFVGDRYVATTLEDDSVRAIIARYPHASTALSLGRDVTGITPAKALAVRRHEIFPEARLAACGAGGIAVHHELARQGLLDVAARRGLAAWVWTVDDDVLMQRFLGDPRVTALITNRPRRAAELRAQVPGGVPDQGAPPFRTAGPATARGAGRRTPRGAPSAGAGPRGAGPRDPRG